MKLQNETGHAINVANFQLLMEQVAVYENYNPPIESLILENLRELYNKARIVLTELEQKRTDNKKAIHNRQEVFENLKPLTTRIINHLEILNLNEGTLQQAKSLRNQIQGSNYAKPKKETREGEDVKTISTSRQSYNQLAENFSILVQLLKTIPNYNPNTADLTLVSLDQYVADLTSSTQQVNTSEASFNTLLIERDNLLYAEDTGLYDTALSVKKYVKSVYGATSPEYDKVSRVEFVNFAAK
ncbi:hypothetical protein [Galbibacter mesophilus]|uniref:hypothetical protein n=1 Tax=Galbibacter mesophilus TaxID=379069 RepID=UPI00191D087C|nr:hypothetical protein [Galbibacter mesophilus]MCM5663218.1 hypothetical protein [Galbibacter mesophilus]